jgi:hypothetical protein
LENSTTNSRERPTGGGILALRQLDPQRVRHLEMGQFGLAEFWSNPALVISFPRRVPRSPALGVWRRTIIAAAGMGKGVSVPAEGIIASSLDSALSAVC